MSKTYATLAQLRVLVAVAERGSFTGAAGVLWMSQSGVSQAVSGLESELGVSLVERDRHGVVTTEAGERVLVHAREMLDRAERIREEASATLGLEAGKVYVGSFPSASATFLPGIMASFRRRYPGVEAVLFEGAEDEVFEWLRTRTLDVGFVTRSEGGVDLTPLTADEMVLVLPGNHPLGGRSAVGLREIAEDPFVMSKSSCEPLINETFRSAGLQPDVRHETTDLGTRLAMVRAGLGLTMVPELALPKDLAGVAAVRLDLPARREISLATRSSDTVSLAAKAFVREAQNWASARGPRPNEESSDPHTKTPPVVRATTRAARVNVG